LENNGLTKLQKLAVCYFSIAALSSNCFLFFYNASGTFASKMNIYIF